MFVKYELGKIITLQGKSSYSHQKDSEKHNLGYYHVSLGNYVKFLVMMLIHLFYLGSSNRVKDTHFPKYPLICKKYKIIWIWNTICRIQRLFTIVFFL